MQIIDAHFHALPRGEMHGGEVDARLEIVLAGLRQRGIHKAILVPINDPSYQPIQAMNDFTEQVVREHPGIVGFIDIDISQTHYYQGIQKLEGDIATRHANGLQGIKVHLQNLGVPADDWRLLPVYRLAGELGIPVMIHCHPGSCPGTVENSHPAAIEKVVRVFHQTTFLISHFGGILYFEYMPWLAHDNVYFECSGVMPDLLRYFGKAKIKYIFEQIGYERICFGSDYPTIDLDAQIAAMQAVTPAEHAAGVFRENILKIGERFGWW